MTKEELLSLKESQLLELAAYREVLYRAPQLRQLFFELTLRCNEHCFHCGSSCSSDAEEGMPASMYKSVLEDVKKHFDIGKLLLCITGGEPLLRRDFFDILGCANELGFKWGMTSNATLITKEVAHRLRESGMRTISVSIDGLEKTHDTLRGLPGAYRLAMQGIDNLLAEDTFDSVQVTTVINHENIHELDDLYTIFEHMDIDSWRVIGLEPIGRALLRPELMLTAEDQKRLFSFIYEKRSAGIPVTYGCSHYLGLELEREVRDWYFICNAGIYTASVMANGDVGACLDIERNEKTIQGNVYETPFSEIWRDRFSIFRKPLSSLCEDCRDCPSEKYCAGGSHHSYDYIKNEQRICMRNILF